MIEFFNWNGLLTLYIHSIILHLLCRYRKGLITLTVSTFTFTLGDQVHMTALSLSRQGVILGN